MTQLQKIVAKAKSLKKSYPNTKWTDLIKKASKLVTPAKKSVSGIKRTVVKKSAPAIPLIKKRIVSKSDFAMAGIKKKKATKKAVKKSQARSLHNDTKSHNVNIRVMSGIKKGDVNKLSKLINEIEFQEKLIRVFESRKKELVTKYGLKSYNIDLKLFKNRLKVLKFQKNQLKKLI